MVAGEVNLGIRALLRRIVLAGIAQRGNSLARDRWMWVRQHLRTVPPHASRLLDAGCGNGFVTMMAASMGYDSLGLAWSSGEMLRAQRISNLLQLPARFERQDLRALDGRVDLRGSFDVVVCMEVIEHILDDAKLLRDIASMLRPGGKLFLTSPNYAFNPLPGDEADPDPVEDGGHVRRGYTVASIATLAKSAGFMHIETSYISGFATQRLVVLETILRPRLGSATLVLVIPLRFVARFIDHVGFRSSYPSYSVTLIGTT